MLTTNCRMWIGPTMSGEGCENRIKDDGQKDKRQKAKEKKPKDETRNTKLETGWTRLNAL